MRQLLFEIKENKPLTKDIMEMVLAGDTSDITRPGQFVNIKLDGLYLRRPISICDAEEGKLTLIYKVVGKGTEQMRDMTEGTLDILSIFRLQQVSLKYGNHPHQYAEADPYHS